MTVSRAGIVHRLVSRSNSAHNAPRAPRLARARRRQDQELEDELGRRHRRPASQLAHELRHLAPWQCCMMRDLPMIGAEFAGDADAGVGSLTRATQDGAVKHGLEALQDAARGLRLGKPDWLQQVEHLGGRDIGDGALANLG